MLGEPRENAFLTCDFEHNDSMKTIEQALQHLGKVRTSTTFPSLCTATVEDTPAVSFISDLTHLLIVENFRETILSFFSVLYFPNLILFINRQTSFAEDYYM